MTPLVTDHSIVVGVILAEGRRLTTVGRESRITNDRVPYGKLLLTGSVLAGFAAGFGALGGACLVLLRYMPSDAH